MLALLPAIVFVLFLKILKKQGWEWRLAALASAVACGTCVSGITEGLSAFGMLTRVGSALAWLAVAAAAVVWMRVVKRKPSENSGGAAPDEESFAGLDAGLKAVASGAVVICGLVLVTALLCPPNTWDAMVYHMPRTVMWMSNQRVSFYPTPDYQQLVFAPWAEYAMTQTMLLGGGDRFANLVEFLSYLGCALGVSLIAKYLGAGIRGQILAGIVSLTIPALVLEASGPMNTAVVTFWIVTSAVFVLAWNESQRVAYIVCAGMAAGLAILTKGLAYIFLPGILLACWWMGTKTARWKLLKWAWIAVVAVLTLNGAHYARCYQLTGSALGMPLPDYTPRLELTIAHKTVSGTVANMVRNVSLHFGTPSDHVNGKIAVVFRKMMKLAGANPDDPAQTWLGDGFEQAHFSTHEIHAGNPVHLLLLLVAGVLAVWAGRRGAWAPVWFAAGIGAAFVYFCASLRWHIWMTRLQLPMFVLGAALIGLAMERYFSRRAANVIAGALVTMGLAFAASNRIRSLVPWSRVSDVYHPREELYFNDEHKDVAAEYIAAATAINQTNCNRIAIDSYVADSMIRRTSPSFFVYPMLALIHADGGDRKTWYSGVRNATVRYRAKMEQEKACAVICLDCAGVSEKLQEYSAEGAGARTFGRNVMFSAPANP
jgi:4-amino-4-deoxy-L-arabinose transferase-like glycosyltransferase